jgi:hypothetical protein
LLLNPKRLAAALTIPVLACTGCTNYSVLPRPPGPRLEAASPWEAAIEKQEVCIGSTVKSAGKLADTLYYRWARTPDGQIAVGYFVFYSTERPWGNNWLTWTLLPALAVDTFYSHALLVAPGYQAMTKGKGDVEGVSLFYDVERDGSLKIDHALADDRREKDVTLSRDDLYALDARRPVVYSETWSHQLGAKNARSLEDLAYERCYQGDHVRPLPDDVARDFHVDGWGRAEPAHVEAMFPADGLKGRGVAKETTAKR